MNRIRIPAMHRHGPHRARGAAVVEFAVVCPALLAILFGIIEFGWVFMLRQTVQNAAREGARVAVLQTATDQQINDRINVILQSAGITSQSVSLTHADGETSCDESVQISVPYADLSLMGGCFNEWISTLEGQCTMRKEGCVLSTE